MTGVRVAYERRTCPDPDQAARLGRAFGCVRLVWNGTLDQRHRAYHVEGEKTSHKETGADLAVRKKADELAFPAEVSSVPSQRTLRHRHAAFQNSFAGRTKYPRFRSRTDKPGRNVKAKAGLNRAVLDAALGEFRRRLEHKTTRTGKPLVVVDR